MATSDKQAMEWFAEQHGLKGGRFLSLLRRRLLIFRLGAGGSVGGSPEWWLDQMRRGTPLGREHLNVIKDYLEAKDEGRVS